MMFLTDFADPAVVLPLALIAALMLTLTDWRRGALLWLIVVAATLGAMAVLKMALFACGAVRIVDLVRSPSGHTASAAIVYGGLAALVARRFGAGLILSFLPVLIAAAVIGFSRVALDVHTLPEVLIGATIGCAGALAMLLLVGKPPPRLPVPKLIGPAIVVIIAMHGYHLHAEVVLRTLAARYAWLAPFCTARGNL
jgi:membrane-associated phospholipid phosphatase